MEIDEIVDYATNSPENTNPAVLRSMLSQLNGGSSGDDMFIIRNNDSGFDISFADIQQAAREGKVLVLYGFPYPGGSCINSYTELLFDEIEPSITFTTLFTDNGSPWGRYIILKPSNDGSINTTYGDVTF